MADQHFTFPAAYQPFMVRALEEALRQIGLDRAWRESDDPRIREFASIPDVDPTVMGMTRVLFIPDRTVTTQRVALPLPITR